MRKSDIKHPTSSITVKTLRFIRISLFLVFFACCTLYAVRYTLLFAQDKIVAIVNNAVITQKDLNDFVNFMRIQLSSQLNSEQLENKIQSMKLDLLNRLIEDRIILQEAKKSNIKIDDNRVKARIDEIKSHFSSDIEFQNALAEHGLVQADIESRIREQLLMYNIIDIRIKSKIIVNPAEVTDFYNKNIDEFKLPEQRQLEVITTEDENLAKEIADNLKEGHQLQDLAQKYSLSINKLIAMRNGQLRKDVEDVVFRLKLGEISEPIKIEDKYYIFKLNSIIAARHQSLSEARDKISEFLFNRKMQEELARWLDELKKQSYIKILAD